MEVKPVLKESTIFELSSILAHASGKNRPSIVRLLLQEGAMFDSALVNRLAGKDVSTDIWEVFVEMGFNVSSLADNTSSTAAPPLK